MENEVSNEYLENAIDELWNFFGIKEAIYNEDFFSLVRNGNVKESIKTIACQLGLPIDINIINVPNDYRAENSDNQFYSEYLAKTNQDGSRCEGITAQIDIPSSLPFYGSSALNNYLISVKISENCTKNPAIFSVIMAHELSHVLLYSLNHPKKENEFYTDLLAIMLGFQDIFQYGRKNITKRENIGLTGNTITTTTTTYGYLNDSQFKFAYNKINLIFKKYQKEKKSLIMELKKYKKLWFFSKCCCII